MFCVSLQIVLVMYVMRVIKSLSKRWASYKYRFVPWMKLKIRNQPTTRVIDVNSDKVIPDEEIHSQLKSLFERFDSPGGLQSFHKLEIAESTIAGAGCGVFFTGNDLPKGQVVALYPGTVYLPYEAIFFQSIYNRYIFKCADGVLIDGNNRGLSKTIYKSCEGRDRISHLPSADVTWLEPEPTVTVNIGQFVNNRSLSKPANVCYQEFDFPVDFDRALRKYIPNVYYESKNFHRGMRTVVLVSTRDISEGEELFSSYYTVIKS